MSKIVTVRPKTPPKGFRAIQWEKPKDWVDVCKFVGWKIRNKNDEVTMLIDRNGREFGVGFWVACIPCLGANAYTPDEFANTFDIVEDSE